MKSPSASAPTFPAEALSLRLLLRGFRVETIHLLSLKNVFYAFGTYGKAARVPHILVRIDGVQTGVKYDLALPGVTKDSYPFRLANFRKRVLSFGSVRSLRFDNRGRRHSKDCPSTQESGDE
jgi:hypothetical protein